MPTHKKYPTFIRITTSKGQVLCLDPSKCSTFQIREKAKVKTKSKDPKDPTSTDEYIEADTVRFFYPVGTGLTYTVGVEITQNDFDYICTTLFEFMYLNQAEFDAKTAAMKKEQMEEWNRISQENSEKLDPKPAQ